MKKLIVVMSVSLLVLSCQSKTQEISKTDDVTVKEMVHNSETVLVDVRIPEQFAEKTAPGAINIPLAVIGDYAADLKGKNVVLFCNSGRQSGQALEILKSKGLNTVYNAKTVDEVIAMQKDK